MTSSTVDETALTILNRQASWGITIASSQSHIIFDIQVIQYWLKWQIKYSKLAAKDFETSVFHQDIWNHTLILGFVLADIAGNAISNLKLWQWYKALENVLRLLSTIPLINICWRKYALTVDAIIQQGPAENEVSSALNSGKNDLIQCITHREAVCGLVLHSILN
jgi:hypothetical protein